MVLVLLNKEAHITLPHKPTGELFFNPNYLNRKKHLWTLLN